MLEWLTIIIFYAYLILMFYRTHWVYKQRKKLRDNMSDDDFCQKYFLYWDFNKMVNRFWVWDIEKMK